MAKNKLLLNLEKVFVILDWEAHVGRCDYRWKNEDIIYCGTFGREVKQKCEPDACPYVYAIVTEAKEDNPKKASYID